jgi:F-box/leucine-rich repeat protein 2/20
MFSINSTDLFLIADCFPLLQELDLSNPAKLIHKNNFSDGVETLSLTLSKLQKINLSRHRYMNNRLVICLFNNCKFLHEAIVFNFDCIRIIDDDIVRAICARPALTSLDFSSLSISDNLLSSIAMEGLPLTKLVLRNCTGYTYDGIFCLLSKCRSFQHLDLQYTRFLDNQQHLTDQRLVQLSSFLGHLISINLNHCRKLTELALFALSRNCPLLTEIKMEYTLIGKESAENSNHSMDSLVCPQLKSLSLANNFWLRDENIIMFASIFPNLHIFYWNNCNHISKGIFFSSFKDML